MTSRDKLLPFTSTIPLWSIPGNTQAHKLAQLATQPGFIPFPLTTITTRVLLYFIAEQNARTQIPTPDPKPPFINTKVGRFVKSFDKALPGKHTVTIYNGRTKKQSQILCQLHTGICRLNSNLAKLQAADSDQCRCNRGSETVDHFLFRCPRWSKLCQDFKRLAANRWDDLYYALGGWSNKKKDGQLDLWTPQTTMLSATINFAIATGRLEDRSNECSEKDEEEEEDNADEDADA